MRQDTNGESELFYVTNGDSFHEAYWLGYAHGGIDAWAADGGGDRAIWHEHPKIECPVHGVLDPNENILDHDDCFAGGDEA
jgi:hypothetical protein